MPPVIFYGCAGRFVSALVRNPKDKFPAWSGWNKLDKLDIVYYLYNSKTPDVLMRLIVLVILYAISLGLFEMWGKCFV